jgi:hypothetical protein
VNYRGPSQLQLSLNDLPGRALFQLFLANVGSMANQNKTVAFRLHDALAARLATQASERQLSIGEFARQIVIEHLGNAAQKQVLDAVANSQETIVRLEKQLRLMTVTLLCNAGHAEPDEALDWVQNHLGPVDDTKHGGR